MTSPLALRFLAVFSILEDNPLKVNSGLSAMIRFNVEKENGSGIGNV